MGRTVPYIASRYTWCFRLPSTDNNWHNIPKIPYMIITRIITLHRDGNAAILAQFPLAAPEVIVGEMKRTEILFICYAVYNAL